MTVIAWRSLLENCGNRFYDLLGDLFGSLLLANGDLQVCLRVERLALVETVFQFGS